MAKFAVGDRFVLIKAVNPENIGKKGTVTGLLPDAITGLMGEQYYYNDIGGPGLWSSESQMRKLPPDDHADDSIEEPGLTRLKKLLEQDTVPHKQTKRERA